MPLLLMFAGAIIIVYVLVAALVLTSVLHGNAVTDWVSFYAAGTLVREGQGARLYDFAAQAAVQRSFFGENVEPNAYPLPAFVAIVLAPLTALPFAASFSVVLVLNLMLLGGIARAGWRYLEGVPGRRTLIACAVVSTPVFVTVLHAQLDLVVLAAIIACLAMLRRERPMSAGAILAIALVKPHVAAAIVLLLIVKGEWRALVGFGSVGIPLLLGPVLLFGPGILRDQIALIASYPGSSTDHRVAAEMMVNVRGLVTSTTGSSNVWLWAVPLLIIALASAAFAIRAWRAHPSTDAQSWALALTLPLLYSPHVHLQTMVLVVAAAVLYVRARADAGRSITAEAALGALVLVAFMWLLATAGLALMCVPLLGLFVVFTRDWPAVHETTIAVPGADADLPLAA